MPARSHLVCWRRLDQPGHDAARLAPRDGGWRLSGTAVLAYDGTPCALTYAVDLDEAWRTRTATVEGWVGDRVVAVHLAVDDAGHWSRNGVACPQVAGCVDVDYGFSPATNLLPVRRLAPAVGESVQVRAAWLRFPELTLEPLEQTYRRVGERAYAYESAHGAFRADLDVDGQGMVIRYGDLWTAEPGACPARVPGAA